MAKFTPPTEEDLKAVPPTVQGGFAPPTEEDLAAVPPTTSMAFSPPTEEDLAAVPPSKEPSKEGGLFVGADITEDELQGIAKQYNLGAEGVALLKEAAPLYGAQVKGDKGFRQNVRYAGGVVSEALGGLPTFIGKKVGLATGDLTEEQAKALDALNALAQKKKSYLQAGGEMATGLLLPGGAALKGASALKTTGIAAAEGAAFGLGESREGEELSSTAFGAGVGVLGLGAVATAGKLLVGTAKGVKAASDLYKAYRAPKEEVADIVRQVKEFKPLYKVEEEITGEKAEAWKKQAEDLYDELKTGVNEDRISTVKKEAVEVLGSGKSFDDLKDKAFQTSKEDFSLMYIRAKTIGAIKQQAPRNISNVGEVGASMGRIVNIVADGMSEMRNIDFKEGSNFAEASLAFAKGSNLAGYAHKAIQSKVIEANRVVYASGKEGNLRIYDSLNKHSLIKNLPEQEKKATETLKDTMEEVRILANENGVPISVLGGDAAEGFLPRRSVDIAESSVRIENKANEIARNTGVNPFEVTEDQWSKILEKGTKENIEFAPLKQTILAYTGRLPDTAEEFADTMRQLINPSSDVFSKQFDIRSLHQRMDVVPEYLLEKNVVKLVNGYLADVVKYIYQKDAINAFDYEIKKLEAIKGASDPDVIAMRKRLNNVLGQVSGLPEVSKKVEMWWRAKMLRAASRMEENTPGRDFMESWAEAPDLIRKTRNYVYGNFLQGPEQFINNFSGAISTFVPEMGNIYGARLFPGAMMRVMANMGKRSYWDMLKKKGYIQVEPGRELVEAAKGGKPTSVLGVAGEVVEKVLTFPFSSAEYLVRGFTYEASQMVFDQMQKGLGKGGKMPGMAGKYFETLTPALQNSIKKQFEAGNVERAREIFSEYISDRVAFSYNKLAQSTAARNLGPAMSAFTKYPSIMVGRSLEVWRENEGFKKVPAYFNYFLVSYIGASLINNLIFSDQKELEEKIFGKQDKDAFLGRGLAGLTNWATVADILQNGQRTPIPIQMVYKTFRALGDLAEGNPDAAYKLVKTLFETFAPSGLGGLPRTVETLTGEDVPYLGKED